jgi:hypothetical protein
MMRAGSDCRERESLVSFLYGEGDPAERERFEAHLKGCAACAEELESLTAVRGALAEWTPPDARLGFRVVPAAQAVPPAAAAGRPGWPPFLQPAWNLALAATLVLVVAAAVASVEVRYADDGFVFRMGWPRGAAADAGPPRGSAAPAPATPVSPDDAALPPWRPDLLALEEALRDEFAGRPAPGGPTAPARPVAARPGAASGEELIRTLRGLIAESERRQQQGFASSLIDLTQEFDLQRRADQQRAQDEMGSLADYLVRVAGRPAPAVGR